MASSFYSTTASGDTGSCIVLFYYFYYFTSPFDKTSLASVVISTHI